MRFLYALGNEHKTIKFGLERIRLLLAALGHPEQGPRFIHVAGTNGKGSVCAMLEAALRASGRRTGLYTSPHLVEPTERIRIAGVPVSQADFTTSFDIVHSTAEHLILTGAIDMHPTYFETVTAMAFHLFRARRADVVVLETGMGGRLDATNVVNPLCTVLTPIDLDHQRFLGSTLMEITYEKCGILKPGRPVIVADQRPDAVEIIEAQARHVGSPLVYAAHWFARDVHAHALGNRFTAVHDDIEIAVDSHLVGAHQIDNTLTAIAALHHLGIAREAIEAGLNEVRWPGRLELVRTAPQLFLDGAHNPAGAAALARYISTFHAGRRVWMVFGAMRDKDLASIGAQLFPLASQLIFTAPRQARAFTPAELRESSGQARAHLIDEPAAAIDYALAAAAPGDVIFVTGSLYLVGEARAHLVRVG